MHEKPSSAQKEITRCVVTYSYIPGLEAKDVMVRIQHHLQMHETLPQKKK